MKITDVEVIHFRTVSRRRVGATRWGYGEWLGAEESDGTGAITRISTDEGVCGHMLAGSKATTEGPIKQMLVGENPLNREKLWHWMDQMSTFGHSLTEHQLGVVDCALWDLAGQKAGLPVYQLLGGTRETVEAYASTFPNLGGPEVYAELARDCVARGYKAFKVHANICWDPHIPGQARQLPGFPQEDIENIEAVKAGALGDSLGTQGGQARGEVDARQVGALPESPIPDAGDALRDRHTSQTASRFISK